MSEAYKYKDSNVWIKKYTWRKWVSDQREWRCPICHKKIINDEIAYLLINNHKYFPNVSLHQKCFEENDLDNILNCIESDYKQFKDLDEIF